MKTVSNPSVIEVDFKAGPLADGAVRPSLPAPDQPTPPVPFRKRNSFMPVRFFSAKRLPQGVPPGDDASDTADGLPDAVGETGSGTAARLTLPPFPEAAAPVGPAPVQDAAAPDPLPAPEAETEVEVVPTPDLAPTLAAAPAPEPTASVSVVPASLTADADSRPDARGASVQLTLDCEVAALRLTPSFGLGAVQLRALSDVVALRFVAPGETGDPLAAAVAFQIVHVELDPASRRLKNLLLKPLDEAREPVTPRPRLLVAGVGLVRGDGHAPISVTAAAQASTAVQLFGTFRLGSIHFTPDFGVGTLRLELASDAVLVRVVPSTLPTARDLPPSFDLAEAELDADGRLAGFRLTPGAATRNL